jgi:Domain of unknown function (DUF5916)
MIRGPNLDTRLPRQAGNRIKWFAVAQRSWLSSLILVGTLSGSVALSAQEGNYGVVPPQLGAVGQGEFRIPLIPEGLKLADFAGGEPRADIRNTLTHVNNFIQQVPNDGQPATEQTEVWLAHTKNSLYFVFICHDRHPGEIRGHLTRRENLLNDDYVSVLFDPFQDRRKGILFTINPAGVQADAAWTENIEPDYSYDQVWDSEAEVTSDGWMALFAIPFRSIRFRANSSDWGVVFMRNLPRNSEVDFWPRVSASVAGTLSQEGTLHGIEGATGSHNMQINPYVLAQSERTLISIDPLNPYFSSRKLEGTAGGEAKLIVKDSIVLDGTINPDFSDVESDQPQFTVNQRYPVYFPELRPFFLENANYFTTPILLVYTRNIVHPEYGIRATGKVGRTNMGFFLIDDREPGETVAPGDPLYLKRSLNAVGRVSRDVGKDSSVGLIYTDEEFGGGWNRIGGIDFTARLSKTWTVLGQMVESSTMQPTEGNTSPSYSAGPASQLVIQRAGRSFNLNSVSKDYSTGFRTELGFIPTSNLYNNQTHVTYQWFPKRKLIQSVGVETNQLLGWDHQGNRLYHYSTFDPFVLLPRNIVFAPLVGQNSDTLGPQDGTLLPENKNFTQNFGGIVFRGAPWTQLNLNIISIFGGNVNYNPVAGSVPSLLHQQTVQALFTVQPVRKFTADNTYLLDRNHSAENGAPVYESQTFRTKLNYQFTRSLSFRAIAEYDSTLVNPAETSLQRKKQIGTQALLTWLPHPGTAVYIGYNDDVQNLDRALCNRLPDGSCDPSNLIPPRSLEYLNDGRQFFIKASYLFRF